MATKHNTPAAGAVGGAIPKAATIRAPEFLVLKQSELQRLLNNLRDGLTNRLYLIFLAESDFKTGEILTSYARLMDLCAPPVPEKGGRRTGPTQRQIRYAIETLITSGMVKRNAEKNEAQGILRLYVKRRKTTGAN